MSKKDNTDVDIIEESIGAYGRYHLFIISVIFLSKFSLSWHQQGTVILAPPAEFECSNSSIAKCSAECPSHVFDKSIFEETIITQWDLVCDNAQLSNVAQLTFMFGVLLGNVIFGHISDKFGRKIPFVAAVVLQVISGVAAAFAPWFWLFVVLRMLSAVATGGYMLTCLVLVMELIGKKYRTLVGIIYQMPTIVGQGMLGLLGYLIRDWHYYQLTVTIPSVIFFSYYWILPESPRWLLTVGRVDKSVEIMEKIAKHNRLETNQIKENVINHIENKSNITQTTGSAYDMIRTRKMRIWSICLFITWLTAGLTFNGSSLYMGQIGGDMFINVAVGGLVQIPGCIVNMFILDKLGRKLTLILSNALCCITLLLITVVPAEPVYATTILASLGILGSSMAITIIYIYTGEIFPTVIRNVGIGTCSTFSKCGSMIAPFIAGLNIEQRWLPPLIFGVSALVGTVACWWLPETRNIKLPDTVEEAEQLGKTTKPVVLVETIIMAPPSREGKGSENYV